MSMCSTPLPVGVIGCGRMGKLHARVYPQTGRAALVGVYDANRENAEAAASQYGTRAFGELDELLGQVKAVTIATPTESHAAIAERCLARGVHCLIEKPLANSVEDGRKIVEWQRRSGAVVQVGHIERFNPAVRALGGLEIRPRFVEVTRVSPMTFRSIDVGVVLDMMIHDIDIVLKLAGSEVTNVEAIGVSVLGGHEDICNARLTFASGCVANMTASRIALKTERKLRVFGPDAYVSLDYQKKYGIVVRRGENLGAIRDAVKRIRAGEVKDLAELDYGELVDVQELAIDDVEPIRAEVDAFLHAISTGTPPPVTAEDGLANVEMAMRIVGAMPGLALE